MKTREDEDSEGCGESERQRLLELLLEGRSSPKGPVIDRAYFERLRERVRKQKSSLAGRAI